MIQGQVEQKPDLQAYSISTKALKLTEPWADSHQGTCSESAKSV
jgi:hypothetical protein